MAYIRKVPAKNKRGYTYSYTVNLPPDPVTGKRRQKTKRGFATKKEAEEAAAKLEYELREGTYVEESNITFEEFVETWKKSYAEDVKISTLRARKSEIDHLLRYFGKLKIRNITKKNYQDALNDLKQRGYADNTIDGIHTTGRMIFRKARELDIIKNNPTEYARLKKRKKTLEDIENQSKPVKYLEKEQLAHFLLVAKEKGLERDYIIFLTLSYTGLRVGELCALKWKDLDFKEQTISITKTYYNPYNRVTEYHLLPPKTEGSIRTIEVDPVVLEELKKHRVSQNELKMKYRDIYHDKDFVFAKVGKYMGYPELIKTIDNRMRRLLKLANLPEILTPHSLRHTHTSLLAEAGVPLEQIMERLGHRDDRITRNIYLHVTKDMKKDASQKFGQLMRSIQK